MLSDKEFQSITDLVANNLYRGKQEDCGLNILQLQPHVAEYEADVNRLETFTYINMTVHHLK